MANSDLDLLQASCPLSLYIHVPFCRSKCPYCDFFSVPGAGAGSMGRVVDQILIELDHFQTLLRPDKVPTVYVGGGTPSMLPGPALERLLGAIRSFAKAPLEWTVEANPESLGPEFLDICRRAGVTRLSLGIQSMQDELLRVLGRPGDGRDNMEALRAAGEHWRRGLSVDLLVGIPGQGCRDLLEDIRRVGEYAPGHVSLYALTPPPGTELAARIDPEGQDRLWLAGFRRLESMGYVNYEIANFAVPGQECLHNLRYWSLDPYLGVGPGAVSTLPAQGGEILRLYHPEDLNLFLQGQACRWSILTERISPKEFLFETLMMGLRLRRGIEAGRFRRRFGRPLPELIPELWNRWGSNGYVQERLDAYALSDEGRLILNTLLLQFREAIDSIVIESITVHWPAEA